MNTRANAKQKRVHCTINGTNGVMIMPDNSTWPEGIGGNHGNSSFSDNTYSLSDWETLQNSGAIFFPKAGYRQLKNFYNVGGNYWSSTYSYDSYYDRYAKSMDFNDYILTNSNKAVYQGCSVRLVHD